MANMSKIELLIFDLDGTLIDSKKDIAHSVNLTFRDVGLPEKPHEVIYGYVGNGVRQLITDAVASDDPALIDQALQIFEQHYLNHLLDETRLFPGMEEVLYRYNGKKLALVTNKPVNYTDKIIKGLKVDKHFEFILAAQPGISLKPRPDMLLKTLDVLSIAPSEAVMIGDSLNDINAARAAKVPSCGVAYGFGDRQVLQSAHPDYFAESCDELLTLF